MRHNDSMIKTTENKFTEGNLIKEGKYLVFGQGRKFVARFKYSGMPVTLGKFRKELIASHTPSSYFKAMEEGKAPLTILQEANPAWYWKIMSDFGLETDLTND